MRPCHGCRTGGWIGGAQHCGKATIVNFWAKLCVPCKAEMPAIQAYYDKGKAQELEILAISMDEARALSKISSSNANAPKNQMPRKLRACLVCAVLGCIDCICGRWWACFSRGVQRRRRGQMGCGSRRCAAQFALWDALPTVRQLGGTTSGARCVSGVATRTIPSVGQRGHGPHHRQFRRATVRARAPRNFLSSQTLVLLTR